MSTTSPIPPSIGRVVIVALPENMRPAPHVTEAPAIINEVHSNDVVNVCLMPSTHGPWPLNSVLYAESPSDTDPTWHWMDYQLKIAETTDPVTGEAK